MKISDLLTLASILVTIIIAVVGGIYAITTNTKRFELSEQYKHELLIWYEKVVFVIEKIHGNCDGKEREEALCQLSALINVGKFYFPNIDKGDGFGADQPCAHQGYRHIALDFLVLIYQMGDEDNIDRCRDKIEYMRRHFTSIVFQIVSPNDRIKRIKQYAKITMPQKMSIEDFMDSRYGEEVLNTIYRYYK